MSVYLLATCDTKGDEAAFVADLLERSGQSVRIVDTGCLGGCAIAVHHSREDVFRAAGTSLEAMVQGNDRGEAVKAAAQGTTALLLEAHARGELKGVLGLGGSAGTSIGTTAMRALPLGVPKLMVSTLASGQVRQYVGDKDITMMNSVVDISGINRISRRVLANAAGAMAGMVAMDCPTSDGDKPLVAATMFGVTTPCVEQARALLEEAGYEVLVFHATGVGGQAFESLIREGLLAGVLDITTTELADEWVGGTLSAGPERLTGAAAMGLPQVVSVGATDMVNFQGRETVPAPFADRLLYEHNAEVTLMRTTAAECQLIGTKIGERVATSSGPTEILLPTHGVSAIDAEGKAFDDPEARRALMDAIAASCGSIPCTEIDHHINDPEFAAAAVARLLALIPDTPTP